MYLYLISDDSCTNTESQCFRILGITIMAVFDLKYSNVFDLRISVLRLHSSRCFEFVVAADVIIIITELQVVH